MDETSEPLSILFSESCRHIDGQIAAVESLRTRSVALLSVAALVAGLFGPHLIAGRHSWWVDLAVWVALFAFGVTVLIALWILTPRQTWEFYQEINPYLDELSDGKEVRASEMLYNLAADSEQSFSVNEGIIRKLNDEFRVACLLVGVQVIAWAIAAR